MFTIIIPLLFATLIVLSYKPRKVRVVIYDPAPVCYKLTKVDAGNGSELALLLVLIGGWLDSNRASLLLALRFLA